MSIEFARALKTVAAGIAATGFLFVQQAAAADDGISRFAVKNCTQSSVLICAYDKTDSSLLIPYDANSIKPGDKKKSSCGSADRCKVVAVVAARTNVDTSANTEVSVALTLGTFGVAGVIIGTMATKNGIKAAVACKGALKDAKDAISAMTDASAKKKAQDALKQKLETSWPKYKDYSFVTENGVPTLVKGDKC